MRLFLVLLLGLGVLSTSPVVAQSGFFDPNTKKWVTYRLTPEAASKIARKKYKRKIVNYRGAGEPGTIVIDTKKRWLYFVRDDGTAIRYGIGVGKEGFTWRGTEKITQKKKWPGWTPPAEMIVRERKNGRKLPSYMPGGPENPLGARALYLGNTLYRIHGTNEDWSIGRAVSSGCIRMWNEDVEHLYQQVKIGTTVKVR
ncbi:L,D-transpeptidase-like protein [Roseibium hamelinense]|uniref:L,D-transpeptidase-like protein n=1 Tax=Roseibium hamelinense TaxID=150831 RepID=A0A562SEY2_9HYPH|nr:L,D-transpeptidase [Roseibium hamelinense]MTI42869.1 L,D-transpeptidase [Roseibium hamelinense]TWI79901.1 L,D-transpeptidase-like protein [Roseibium hamelinense]